MKKILLIVAVVLCVAVAGTALAATVYYNANPVSGTVTADSYVELSLDGTETTQIALVQGIAQTRKIHCDVTTSATNDANGTLTITLAAASGKTLTGVTATLYSDESCEAQYAIAGKTQTGAGSITVTDITADTDYWVVVTFAGAADAEALAAIGGTIDITFEQA